MKLVKALLYTAVAGLLAVNANKVSAVPGPINISVVATSEVNTNPASGIYLGKAVKNSFKTKDVLQLLADATGNGWFTNKNSRLMYDPDILNDEASTWYEDSVYGEFWVTNTATHDFFRLDGNDVDTNYFSYVEFDFEGWTQGFSDNSSWNEDSVDQYTQDNNKNKETDHVTGNGTFYVHDDPYDFAYTEFFGENLFDNDNGVVLTGLVKFTWEQNGAKVSTSFSFNGSGDGTLSGQPGDSPVCTGSVSFSGHGLEE